MTRRYGAHFKDYTVARRRKQTVGMTRHRSRRRKQNATLLSPARHAEHRLSSHFGDERGRTVTKVMDSVNLRLYKRLPDQIRPVADRANPATLNNTSRRTASTLRARYQPYENHAWQLKE